MTSKRLLSLLYLLPIILAIYSCNSDDPDPIILEPVVAVDNSEEETDETSSDDSNDTDDDDSSDENNDESDNTDDNDNDDTATEICTNPSDFLFNESNGLVLVEFEQGNFSGNWALKTNGNSHTGDGYMVWEGSQYFGQPGNGIGTFKIKISNPGVYRFIWSSAIKTGNNGTEHNDTWLRFNDANDFYGKKGNSIIYPSGSGKSPNPKGASKDGWFKIFRSGSDLDFKWQSRTSDNDAHEVYVKFNDAGTYTMEVSARSSGHAIDKFVLFKNSLSEADATSSMELSTVSCD